MQIAKIIKNALLSVAAIICAADAKGDVNYVVTRVSYKKLQKLYSYNSSLINEDYINFNRLIKASKIKQLNNKNKVLRILNATIGLTIKVSEKQDTNRDYKFKALDNIFKYYNAVQKQGQTPKKAT